MQTSHKTDLILIQIIMMRKQHCT